VTTQKTAGGEWHTQLGTWLGAIALAMALYALLRDNPNTRVADSTLAQQTAEIQLRDAIVKLQESMSRDSSAPGERPSAAKSWLYFQSAQEMLAHKNVKPTLAGCLVLANFAFAHADVAQGNYFLTLANTEISRATSPVTQCLAEGAIGHFMFEHAPTTPITVGRERYAEAVAKSNKLTGQGAAFVQLNILKEWSLDEFAAGEEKSGDTQQAAAVKLLENEAFSPAYRSAWEHEMETAIIQAKVRGKLL